MPKITQHIFNQKTLNSRLESITLESIIDHTSLLDIKRIIDNWCSLIERNILEDKSEISLQDSFLNDIFCKILDYKSISESPNSSNEEWHLYREKKTITDSTRSDAALGFFSPNSGSGSDNEDVRIIIELKNAKTSLDEKQKRKGANYTPVEQAFLYSGKFSKKCKWVIVSNYKEIRLYNRKASMNEYESFLIEKLKDEAELKKFIYLLSRKHLIAKDKDSIIDSLYSSNEAEQEKISKEFYCKYKNLRLHVFEHLKQKNSDYDNLTLLEKTQKMLDRFIFIRYCEDLGLMPKQIFKKAMEIVNSPIIFAKISRWGQLKGLFRAIDLGRSSHNISKFNGGLFEFDEILDSKLLVGDEIFDAFVEISSYDFESELNINILGHIFEQSISDIEEIKAAITGSPFVRKNGKRKKDGIFYTPEYITRYIVEQTVGGWLEDRKQELGFENLPELIIKPNGSGQLPKKGVSSRAYNKNIKIHLEFWHQYKKKLSNIKVLDPACGSGAFLNQAFDFLYKEGQYVNDQIAKLQEVYDVFELDKHILQNNLFGVDLNPESVEITKLSLWLKTANRYSELTSIDDNIKCGNSLIDDPEIAGDRAFSWEHEFSEIMKNGGFDVVIGNPPYVRADVDSSEYQKQRRWLEKSRHYQTLYEKWDLMVAFVEKALLLLQKDGHFSFIVSNSITTSKYSFKLLDWILKNFYLQCIDYFDNIEVFENVGVIPVILTIKNSQEKNTTKKNFRKNSFENVLTQTLSKTEIEKLGIRVFKKNYKKIDVNVESIKLGDICYISYGLRPNSDERFWKGEFGKKDLISDLRDDLHTKEYIEGKNIKRYKIDSIKFLEWDTERVPKKLVRPTFNELYNDNKLFLGIMTGGTFDDTGIICNHSIAVVKRFIDLEGVENNSIHNSIIKNNSLSRKELEKISEQFDLKYILAIINSKYANKYLNNNRRHRLENYFYPDDFRKLPIPHIHLEQQQSFISKADIMLSKTKELHELKNGFLNFLKSELKPQRINKKLENWPELNWEQFKNELAKCKAKIKALSLKERREWQSYFEEHRQKAEEIKNIIDNTDRKIDQMVYELYGLSQEEIQLLET